MSLAGLGCTAGGAMTSRPSHHGAASGPKPRAPSGPVAARLAFSAAATDTDDKTTALLLSTTARCPAEMALVDDRVCVDRWEGSLVERIPGQRARPWSP